jgi:hypothetical protein
MFNFLRRRYVLETEMLQEARATALFAGGFRAVRAAGL